MQTDQSLLNDSNPDSRFVIRTMTWDTVIAVASDRMCRPIDFILRLELAAFGDRKAESCRPSCGTLARNCLVSENTIRATAKRLKERGRIRETGTDQRGIAIYKVVLPAEVAKTLNRLMILRAFQHHLPPVERSILICIAGYADNQGRTLGHCPGTEDLSTWLQVTRKTIAIGLKALVDLGLICLVAAATGRPGECDQYDLTFSAEAMAWTPATRDNGIKTGEKFEKSSEEDSCFNSLASRRPAAWPIAETMGKNRRGPCVNSEGGHGQNLHPTNDPLPTNDNNDLPVGGAPRAAPDEEPVEEPEGEHEQSTMTNGAPPATPRLVSRTFLPTRAMQRFAAKNRLSNYDQAYVTDAVVARLGPPPATRADRGRWSAAWFAIAKQRCA